MLKRLSTFVLETWPWALASRPVAGLWRRLTQNLGAGYRPELHYMRGPGPKWHERNSRGPA